MIERRRYPRFAQEPRFRVGITGQLRRQELERYRPVESSVPRLVDHARPPGTDGAEDLADAYMRTMTTPRALTCEVSDYSVRPTAATYNRW